MTINEHSGKIVYIVEMLRNGDRESHSYILGTFSDRKMAEYEAQFHMCMRAGKYDAEIHMFVIDELGTSKELVCRLNSYMQEYELEIAIKSREDYIKYRNNKYGVGCYK